MKPSSNPMRELLKEELGIDAFALDGDASPLQETWEDRPNRRRAQPIVQLPAR